MYVLRSGLCVLRKTMSRIVWYGLDGSKEGDEDEGGGEAGGGGGGGEGQESGGCRG
jgi:hypothetical protein